MIINNIRHITASECVELCKESAVLVDLREEYETAAKQFGIENIIYLPWSEFFENYNKLPKTKLLIFADCVGLRSKEAVEFLGDKDFPQIANLAGGILDWERGGQKVIRNRDEMVAGVCACNMKSKKRKINYK